MIKIKQEIREKGGSFYYEENGQRLAEMVYVNAGSETLIIEHTEVNGSLKGKGIGRKLLGSLVEFARAEKIRVIALCPFAKAIFKRSPEWQDVLSKSITPI
ncbi:MAG: GNAT family N-acetyltransferase [Bacteroidia bacterium]